MLSNNAIDELASVFTKEGRQEAWELGMKLQVLAASASQEAIILACCVMIAPHLHLDGRLAMIQRATILRVLDILSEDFKSTYEAELANKIDEPVSSAIN